MGDIVSRRIESHRIKKWHRIALASLRIAWNVKQASLRIASFRKQVGVKIENSIAWTLCRPYGNNVQTE